LILPRLYLNDVKVNQSRTSDITIPPTGLVTFESGQSVVGSVFQKKDGKLVWLHQFDPLKRYTQLVFQPGEYVVIYRYETANSSTYTIEKSFTVKPQDQYTLHL
jgi:hypothetical protein